MRVLKVPGQGTPDSSNNKDTSQSMPTTLFTLILQACIMSDCAGSMGRPIMKYFLNNLAFS